MSWRLPNFDPVRTLGTSRTGTVVLAKDTETGSVSAVKYLAPEVYNAPGFADTYRREAGRLMALDHDNLAAVQQYVEHRGAAAIIGEFVDGVSLRSLLASGALEAQAALYVIKSVLSGLAAAHRQALVHRDLRPENILVTSDLVVKVTDLGVPLPPAYGSGLPGDPRYRSPELWLGHSPNAASDVFAAASVLVECLTGAPASAPGGKPLGFAAVTGGEATPLLPYELPAPLASFLERSLSIAAGGRPFQAGDMLAELRSAAVAAYGEGWEYVARSGLAVRLAAPVAPPPPPPSGPRTAAWLGRARPVLSRRRSTWIMAGTSSLAIIAIGLVLLIVAPSQANNGLSADTLPSIPGPVVPVRASPVPGGDTTGPEEVTGVKVVSRAQTAITLDWDAAFDNVGVTGYIVQRNGMTVGTSYTPGFTDQQLTAKTTYTYTVVAFDAVGNQSDPSAPVTATTLVAPDKTPPSTPNGLYASGRNSTVVVLDWSAAKDDMGVAGYTVYRDGRQVGTVVQPGFRDTGLKANTTYRYQIRAYDASGNQSKLSGTLSVTTLKASSTTPLTPTPTPKPTPKPTPTPTSNPTPSPSQSDSPTPSPSDGSTPSDSGDPTANDIGATDGSAE